MHRSVLVNPNERQPPKVQYRVKPGSEMAQEVVGVTEILILCQQRSAVLPNGVEPAGRSFIKLVRKTSGPLHLTHRQRQPSGVRVNHEGLGGGRPLVNGVPGSHEAHFWVSY